MRQVLINGTDYNDYVESVAYDTSLGDNPSCQIYCIDGMPEIQAFSPIEIRMGSSAVFKGYVGAPDETHGERPQRLIGVKYDCYSYGKGFKDILVSGDYTGPAGQIIDFLCNKYIPEYAIKRQVEHSSMDIIITVSYSYAVLTDVFDNIMQNISGYWTALPNDTIYFFIDSIGDIDETCIRIPYMNVVTPYNHVKATDEVVNKVIVLGGEGESDRTEKWVYDGTHNRFILQEKTESITATMNGDPVYILGSGSTAEPSQDTRTELDDMITDNANTRTDGSIRYVEVSHIAAVSATKDDLYQWHVTDRGWSDIGYHWYVRKDGSVYECRPETKEACVVRGHNGYIVSVAVEGNYEYYDVTMPAAQFNSLVTVIINIMNRYKLPRTNLVYANELVSTASPGKYFPKSDVRNAVQGGSASNYSYNPPATAGPDSNKRLNFDSQYSEVSLIDGYIPSVGTLIEIKYKSKFEVLEEVVDRDSIIQYGRTIPRVIADTSITTKAIARAVAQGIINQSKHVTETVNIDLIDYVQVFSGDKVYLEWLDRYGLVTGTNASLDYNDEDNNSMSMEVRLI